MISDDEVYRTLPAVVVCTVDKLATIAFQPHFSHFTHGPAYACPEARLCHLRLRARRRTAVHRPHLLLMSTRASWTRRRPV